MWLLFIVKGRICKTPAFFYRKKTRTFHWRLNQLKNIINAAIGVWLLVTYPANSCRAACWCRPSSSMHWSSLPHRLLFLSIFLWPSCLCFPVLGLLPCSPGDSRSHQQLTLVHPMRSYQSTCNIQYSHVNRSTCKDLEIQRGQDQMTIFMWLDYKSCNVF